MHSQWFTLFMHVKAAAEAATSNTALLRPSVRSWLSYGAGHAQTFVPQCASLRVWSNALRQDQLQVVRDKLATHSDNPTRFNLVAWLEGEGRRGEGVSALALPAAPSWRSTVVAHVSDPSKISFRVSACDKRSLFRLLPLAARLQAVERTRWLPPYEATQWR